MSSANNSPSNIKYNEQLFEALLIFSAANSRIISELNLTALNAFAELIALAVESSFPNLDDNMRRSQEALRPIAERCRDLVPRDDLSIVPILEQISLSTASLLNNMPNTELSTAFTDCFAQARYEAMPSVLSQALSAETLPASDIAFVKLSKLTPLMGDRITYPRGFKTSLSRMNVQTAADLSTESEVSYDTRSNLFRHGEAVIDSRGLNIVTAGKAIIRDENTELFSEGELIDFVSKLSTAPMMGMRTNPRTPVF